MPQQTEESVAVKNDISYQASDKTDAWQKVCTEMSAHNDPVLYSIFQQATVHTVSGSTLTIALPRANPFFQNKISENERLWKPVIQKHFASCTALQLISTQETEKKKKRIDSPSSVNPDFDSKASSSPDTAHPSTGLETSKSLT